MTTRPRFPRLLTALALLVGPAACTVSTQGTAPESGTTTGAGGGSTTTTTATTGTGMGGGSTTCVPNSMLDCYSGPAGTEGKGICKGGTETCAADGSGFGACVGEVLPQAEDCDNQIDDDCDGEVNNGCSCTPGETADCYDGPAGTEGVGLCVGGTKTCNADGKSWGACTGEVVPAQEDCATPDDEDCDGKAFDDTDSGCVCQPGSIAACDTGIPGVCGPGSKTCDASGTTYGMCVQSVQPSFDDCVTAADEDCDGVVAACTGGVTSAKRFGMGTDDVIYGVGIDAQGNVFAGGATNGSIGNDGYGVTSTSGMLVKLDAQENQLWSKTFTAPNGVAVVRGVGVDPSGDVFAFGTYAGTVDWGGSSTTSTNTSLDVFLVKYDGAGTLLWVKSFGDGADQTASAATCDDQGNVVVAGTFNGHLNFGSDLASGGSDAFMAKLDPDGTQIWARKAGDPQFQRTWGVAAGPNETTLVIGEAAGKIDLGGGNLTTAGSTDVFVAKYDAAGAHVWSKIYGDSGTQRGYGVAVDAQQNVIITGEVSGSVDFGCGALSDAGGGDAFVARLNSSGACIWSKREGDGNEQVGRAVATDPAGNVVVTGFMYGSADFGGGALTSAGAADAFVAKLQGGNGNHVWSYAYGDGAPASNDQYGWAAAIDAKGNAWIGGAFEGTLALPGSTLTSTGGFDGFVAELKP